MNKIKITYTMRNINRTIEEVEESITIEVSENNVNITSDDDILWDMLAKLCHLKSYRLMKITKIEKVEF